MSRPPIEHQRLAAGVDHQLGPQRVVLVQVATCQTLVVLQDLKVAGNYLDGWKGKVRMIRILLTLTDILDDCAKMKISQ